MKPFLSRFSFRVAVLFVVLAYGRAFAADGELKNGDFVETWRVGNLSAEQMVPKYWFPSEPETTGHPWVKILDGDNAGVEIKAGTGNVTKFLYQDVRIDGTKSWSLKWKCKGEGVATVSIVPRDDDGNLFPAATKSVKLSDSPDEDEIASIPMPAETKIIRIILAPGASSTVIFQDLVLTPLN